MAIFFQIFYLCGSYILQTLVESHPSPTWTPWKGLTQHSRPLGELQNFSEAKKKTQTPLPEWLFMPFKAPWHPEKPPERKWKWHFLTGPKEQKIGDLLIYDFQYMCVFLEWIPHEYQDPTCILLVTLPSLGLTCSNFHCIRAIQLGFFKIPWGAQIFWIHCIVDRWQRQRGVITFLHVIVKTRNQECDILEYTKCNMI